MRKIKKWNSESNYNGFIMRERDEGKEFEDEYREYIEGFYEEYYSDCTEGYIHRHFENEI